MAINVNTTMLAGRLTKDPLKRENSDVVNLTVAVNYQKRTDTGEIKEHSDFIPVSVWGKTGDICMKKLQKGSPVFVEGRIKTRNKEVQGVNRFFMEVVASKVTFLDRSKLKGEEEPVPVAPESATDDSDF
jgi:single-strand DNA-binding protein